MRTIKSLHSHCSVCTLTIRICVHVWGCGHVCGYVYVCVQCTFVADTTLLVLFVDYLRLWIKLFVFISLLSYSDSIRTANVIAITNVSCLTLDKE